MDEEGGMHLGKEWVTIIRFDQPTQGKKEILWNFIFTVGQKLDSSCRI